MKKLLLLCSILLALFGCEDQPGPNEIAEVKLAKAEYIGTEGCVSCHQGETEKWKQSHHYEAMHEMNAETVLADWSGTFEADGVSNIFYKSGEDYFVVILEEGITDTLKVVHTFGFQPLQQYLYEADNGKLQTLRATWDSNKNQWFNQHAGEVIPRGDWLHQDGQSMGWNAMCASCHSTNLTKAYNSGNKSYSTTFSHVNLTCESCHGPASNHIKLVAEEGYSADKSGFKAFKAGLEGQLDMCGGCHSRREELYDNAQPNDHFEDAYNIAWINDRLYYPDGQIDEEDYVVGSFLTSKMHKNGVVCTSCHDPHSNALKLPGNTLCMSCHEPKYNTQEHHFHEPETTGAQCINCHMDGKTYMGNDYRRDHSFRIPRPDQSVEYGTPNACISCHTEKTDQWAAKAVNDWYGAERAPHFSDRLMKGYIGGDSQSLLALANDTTEPAIIRGTAIHYLAEMQMIPPAEDLRDWTIDEEYLVRKASLEVARNLPPEEQVQFVSRMFRDRSKVVRVEAVRNGLLLDESNLGPAYVDDYKSAVNEYIEYLDHVADFPDGQAQSAQYYYANQQFEAAIAAYLEALQMDSLRVDLRTNLAVTYNLIGENVNALKQLDLCIAQEPNHRTYYLRGLLQAENQAFAKAASDLENAIELNDAVPTYFYNLILVYNQLGESQKAKKLLQVGMSNFPTDQRLASLQQFVN